MSTFETTFTVTDASGSFDLSLDGLLHFLATTTEDTVVEVVSDGGHEWHGQAPFVDEMLRRDYAAHIPYWHQHGVDSTTMAMAMVAERLGHNTMAKPWDRDWSQEGTHVRAIQEAVDVMAETMQELDGATDPFNGPIWESFMKGVDDANDHATSHIQAQPDVARIGYADVDDGVIELPEHVTHWRNGYKSYQNDRWTLTFYPRIGDNDESWVIHDRYMLMEAGPKSLRAVNDDVMVWRRDTRLMIGDRYLHRMNTNPHVEAWENEFLMVQHVNGSWDIVLKATGEARFATNVEGVRVKAKDMLDNAPPERSFTTTFRDGFDYDDDWVDNLFPVSGGDHDEFDPFDFQNDDGFTIAGYTFKPMFRHTHGVLFGSERFSAIALTDGSWMLFDDGKTQFFDFCGSFALMDRAITRLTASDDRLRPFVVVAHESDDGDLTVMHARGHETAADAVKACVKINDALRQSPIRDELIDVRAFTAALESDTDTWDWSDGSDMNDAVDQFSSLCDHYHVYASTGGSLPDHNTVYDDIATAQHEARELAEGYYGENTKAVWINDNRYIAYRDEDHFESPTGIGYDVYVSHCTERACLLDDE